MATNLNFSLVTNDSVEVNESQNTAVHLAFLAADYMTYRIAVATHVYVLPFIVFFGLIGNTLSFLIMLKPHNRRISCCNYIAALSVSDTLMLFNALDYWTISLKNRPLFYIECNIMSYLFGANSFVSMLLIFAMTVDRFLAIRLPFKSRVLCTPYRARVAIAVIVTVCLLYTLPYFFTAQLIMEARTCVAVNTTDIYSTVYNWINIFLGSIVPFFGLLVLNAFIIVTVRRRGNFSASAGEIENTKKKEAHTTIESVTENLEETITARPKSTTEETTRETSIGAISVKPTETTIEYLTETTMGSLTVNRTGITTGIENEGKDNPCYQHDDSIPSCSTNFEMHAIDPSKHVDQDSVVSERNHVNHDNLVNNHTDDHMSVSNQPTSSDAGSGANADFTGHRQCPSPIKGVHKTEDIELIFNKTTQVDSEEDEDKDRKIFTNESFFNPDDEDEVINQISGISKSDVTRQIEGGCGNDPASMNTSCIILDIEDDDNGRFPNAYIEAKLLKDETYENPTAEDCTTLNSVSETSETVVKSAVPLKRRVSNSSSQGNQLKALPAPSPQPETSPNTSSISNSHVTQIQAAPAPSQRQASQKRVSRSSSHNNQMKSAPSLRQQTSMKRVSKSGSRENQLTIMLLLVTFTFLLLTVPLYVRYLLAIFWNYAESVKYYADYLLLAHLSNRLFYANSACNFFLYCISGNKFRQDVKDLFVTNPK